MTDTTFSAPSGAQREALRNAGWGLHIRYLRGVAEIIGRHGEGYLFPLTAEGMEQLDAFIAECVSLPAAADLDNTALTCWVALDEVHGQIAGYGRSAEQCRATAARWTLCPEEYRYFPATYAAYLHAASRDGIAFLDEFRIGAIDGGGYGFYAKEAK